MDNILEIENLSKSFSPNRSLRECFVWPFKKRGPIEVLKNINIKIPQGKIFGLVGANGSGKTTLIKLVAGLLTADYGIIEILPNSTKKRSKLIGYIPSDERSFFWRLSGLENLLFFAKLHGMSKKDALEQIDKYLDYFDLQYLTDQPFKNYSSGTKKKFSLIRGLIHRPRLLLIDEATNTLDRQSASRTLKLVENYIAENPGSTAIWSTHRHDELNAICDKSIEIKNGNLTEPKAVPLDKKASSGLQSIDVNLLNDHIFPTGKDNIVNKKITLAVRKYPDFIFFTGGYSTKEMQNENS